jgi:pimeloyl-ACP methyl ester carboxylesterase
MREDAVVMTPRQVPLPDPDMRVRSGAAELAVSIDGTGTPLVALHAGVCDRRSWRWCASRWADAGFSTISYDRRGFGQTRYEAGQYDALDDLRAVTAAAGCRPAVVVGNSMGGALAIDLALAYPDEVLALVLIGSLPRDAPDEMWVQSAEETAVEAEFEAAERSGDDERVNEVEVRYWLDGPAQPEGRVTGTARELMLDMNRRAVDAPDPGQDADRPGAWDRLERISVPTLLLVGEYDESGLAPLAQVMATRMPSARLERLDDTAHCPMLDAPDRLADTVLAFLGRSGVT